MEEIDYKLKKRNAVLIGNTIAKLVDIIRQKNDLDPGNTLKLSELKYLQQKCEDAEPLVSITAGQGVIALVEMGILPLASALSGLVAGLVRARNYSGIISSLGHLLVIDLESRLAQRDVYKCPFSIRNPQHPIITVLKQEKDVWIDIFCLIKCLLNHSHEIVSKNAKEMLKPVILYILCTPAPFSHGCKLQIWDLLLKLPNMDVDFLLEILSWLQVDDETQLNCIVSLHSQMCEFALVAEDTLLCAALSPRMASLARNLVEHGHDPRSCFSHIVQLLKVSGEASSCVLILLSEIVTICPVLYMMDVLNICKVILETKACNQLSVKMLQCCLLSWLVYPSYLTSDTVHFGGEILSLIKDLKTWGIQTGKLLPNKYFNILRSADEHIDIAVHLCRMGEIWQNNPSVVREWVERVSIAPKQFIEKLYFALSALLMHSFEDPDVQKKTLKLLLSLVENHHELSGSLMNVILYKLSNETEPNFLLELLRSLTQMAVLKENITLIVYTLETLKNNQALKSVVLDLYLRLWKIENRFCYPNLEKLLQEELSEATWDFQIARAAVIKEICETRPEPYSAELASMISKILTRCSDGSSSLASSLALQGLTALCKAGIADIVSTYEAVAPKLNRDKRPLVIKSWCEFLGTIPSLRCVTPKYEKLIVEVTLKLWNYVVHANNIEIVDAAFSALSKFNLDRLTLKGLPESFRQGLKLPSNYAKTPIEAARKPEDVLPYIPSECWVQMLLKMKPEALRSGGNLLSCWLSSEAERFHYTLTHAEPANYSHLPPQCICRGLVKYLGKTYDPEEVLVVKECLRILSRDYKKQLPPLNWVFLSPFLELQELQEHCIALAAKQCSSSPSARRVLEDFIRGLVSSGERESEIFFLFSNLAHLCKGIPPIVLKPFIEESLRNALHQTLENDNDLEMKKYMKELFSCVKNTLKVEDIHDSNRTMLTLIIESLLEKFNVDSPLFSSYVDCVVELRTKYIERMSSPSVWWEVPVTKLRIAMGIRTAMACRADTEVPLVWLNECIDATINMTGEHSSVLKSIASVLVNCRENETNCPWTLELMGRIQLAVNTKNETNNQQTVVFLCDIYILTVIVLSGYECLNASLEGVSTSREVRLRLFPQALAALLTFEKWNKIQIEMVKWLLFMQNNNSVLPMYTAVFRQGIAGVNHDKQFRESGMWTRFLDSSEVKS